MRGLSCLFSIVLALAILPANARLRWPADQMFFSLNHNYKVDTVLNWTDRKLDPNPSSCTIVLSKRDSSGGYSTIWSVPCTSKCGPGKALVCNNGRYVVTLGDWFFDSAHFVIVYGDGGRIVRQRSLDDLLQETHTTLYPEYKRHLQISDGGDASRPWIDEPRIDEASDRLSFILRTRRKPVGDRPSSQEYHFWASTPVTVKLSNGKLQ